MLVNGDELDAIVHTAPMRSLFSPGGAGPRAGTQASGATRPRIPRATPRELYGQFEKSGSSRL